jgi:serine/threonine-protein kinase RsbW
MTFEVHLISGDSALEQELGAALGEQRAALRRLASPAELLDVAASDPMPRALVVVEDAHALDPVWWRTVRARAPQAQLVVVCRKCSDEIWRRWILLGATAVLRAPLDGVDLEAEYAGEPQVSSLFRRHPGLASSGKTMFRYTFPSDPQYIPGIVHVVSLLAMEFGFTVADYTMNLPLALDEAVSNAIIHGNRRDVRKNVEVEGQIDAQLVRLKIRDEGKGFRREQTRDPLRPENLLAPSGRGLLLIESVMDEVRYTQEGRCIEMHKRARPAEGSAV